MELNEYIRRNYKTPNPFILKDLGACDELIAYLRYTPENTNFNVADEYCGDTDTYTVRWIGNGNSIIRTDLMKVGDTVVAPELPEDKDGCRLQDYLVLFNGTNPEAIGDENLGAYSFEDGFTLMTEMVEYATTHDLMAFPVYEC